MLSPWGKAKGSNSAAKRGLTYERRVGRELELHTLAGRFSRVEHTPWFDFADLFGVSACAPDFLLHGLDGRVTVVEVKLTWVPTALPKLNDLYIPVVELALGKVARPLVIVKALTPEAPKTFATSLSEALSEGYTYPLVWPANRRIPW
jgi:hypothetical protein